MPGAALPLWQLAQLVVWLKLAWSTCAPPQPLVLWQFSQLVTPAWVLSAGLPRAARKLPVWHVAHWVLVVKLLWKRPVPQVE